jgi:hypothetical protein
VGSGCWRYHRITGEGRGEGERARNVMTTVGGLWKRVGDFIWVMRTLRQGYTVRASLA